MKNCKSDTRYEPNRTPPENISGEKSLKKYGTHRHKCCWVEYFACWLLLVHWVSAQSVPWLVDTIGQSTPSSTTTPTYVDRATHGDTVLQFARGLPVFDGELFTCGLYYRYRIFDNVRIYTPKGAAVLNFSTGTTGIGVAIIKSVGSSLSVMTSSKLSDEDPNFFLIQPVAVSGGLMATTGSRITKRPSQRITFVSDERGTIYFFGAFSSLLRISSVDGSIARQSAVVGSVDY